MDRKKVISIGIFCSLVLLLIVGFSYSAYIRKFTGNNNQLVVGDIYVKYNGSNTIINNNLRPMTKEEALASNDNIFEFTILGKNTSDRDIIYGIKIDNNGTINDRDIVFYLEQVIPNDDPVILVDGKRFDDLDEYIYTDTIDGGTMSEITKTFRLRVWLRDGIIVSDTEENANYTSLEWANATLNLNVTVTGDFDTKTIGENYPHLLYNVLKDAAEEGTYAKAYDGSHQDSMDSSKSTETIYHWYAGTNDNGTEIYNNKYNVVFAGLCWQMIRTTDTGGVRLLYNGIPTTTVVDGETEYDCGTSRPGPIGDKINTTPRSLNGSYYYGDGYTTTVSGNTTTYTLTNARTIQVTSGNGATRIPEIASTYPYTCGNTSTSCTTLYKVVSHASSYNANVYQSTSRDSIGVSAFNSNSNSVASVGYMYNTVYLNNYSNYISNSYSMLSSVNLTSSNLTSYGNYYFGEKYSLNGVMHYVKMNNDDPGVKGNTMANYPSSWAGMYMCDSNLYSNCSNLYYIAAVDTSGTTPKLYRAGISGGREYNDSAYKFLFGDSIVDNGDGTFEIKDNVQEVVQKDWASEYSTKNNKYVCMPGYYTYVNNKYICSDGGQIYKGALRYITATTISGFTATSIYKYGFGIESYNNSYRLIGNNNEDGTLQYIYNWPNTSTSNCFTNPGDSVSNCGYKTLTKSHYTCFNLTGICDEYYYIHYSMSSITYSTKISDGKYVSTDLTDHNNILYLMLYQNDANGVVNTTNSTIKGNVDLWYQNTLLSNYDRYIDDTIYCNNRSIKDVNGDRGWNPNGGDTVSKYKILFSEDTVSSDLSCPNVTDKFSITNEKARLTYKVGLMSSPEMNLLSRGQARLSAYYSTLISPSYYGNNNAYGRYMDSSGGFGYNTISNTYNVRPAISLISGAAYSRGNGRTDNPYVVDFNA